MFIPFYILAALLVFISYRSFRGGIEYLDYVRSELAKPLPAYTPFVSVIAPCKGLDDGLEKNLAVLLEQNYADYEIIFVVDDPKDAAVPVINGLTAADERTKLIIAPKCRNSAQKIENLREGVRHIDDRCEVLVFVDSDARPSEHWLGHLVAPLHDRDIGAATGYRWFISGNANLASELRSVWNASVASALGTNMKSNFCWGGSTAIRRDLFDELGVRSKWDGTLSDDFALTRILKEADMPICFVPRALTASIGGCTIGELFEFTTRQMKITRVYQPHLWKMSLIGSGLFNAVWVAGILILVFSPANSLPWAAAMSALLLVSLFSVGKSWLRLKAVKLAMPGYRKELAKQSVSQNILWLFSPFVFFYNSLAALFSRRMRWRGITYELKSPTETVIITK